MTNPLPRHIAVSQFLNDHIDSIAGELSEWVHIPSIAAVPEHAVDVARSAHWLAGEFRRLGFDTDLIETGAYDVLVIADRPGASGDLMVPNHPDFVPEIDPAAGRLVVRPPEWDS